MHCFLAVAGLLDYGGEATVSVTDAVTPMSFPETELVASLDSAAAVRIALRLTFRDAASRQVFWN